MLKRVRLLFAWTLALAAGAGGLALVFTDFFPGSAGPLRPVVGAAYFALAGLAVGLVAPPDTSRWLAGLASWATIALGLVGLQVSLTDPASADLGLAVILLVGPLSCALAGGSIAARLGARAERI